MKKTTLAIVCLLGCTALSSLHRRLRKAAARNQGKIR